MQKAKSNTQFKIYVTMVSHMSYDQLLYMKTIFKKSIFFFSKSVYE